MREAGIPSYPTPARAVRALAALTTFAEPAHRRRVRRSAPHRVPTPGAHSTGTGTASRRRRKCTLDGGGAQGAACRAGDPGARLAGSSRAADDAAAAVEECGGRAVLKAVVPGLVHKSEAGGVVVGVTAETRGRGYDALAGLGGGSGSRSMVAGGVEALVGFAPSPLGPVLTVGVGGVLTEIVADVALRVLPVSPRTTSSAMIDETRLGALLAGVRGARRADRDALVDVVVRLSELVGELAARLRARPQPGHVPAGQGAGARRRLRRTGHARRSHPTTAARRLTWTSRTLVTPAPGPQFGDRVAVEGRRRDPHVRRARRPGHPPRQRAARPGTQPRRPGPRPADELSGIRRDRPRHPLGGLRPGRPQPPAAPERLGADRRATRARAA